jgi:hypothetical protein
MRQSCVVLAAFSVVLLAVPCGAQCVEWQVNIGNSGLDPTPADGSIQALASYDEGAGARLFAGGRLDVSSNRTAVARWDGASWNGLGNFGTFTLPTGGSVVALCIFDDGVHPVLVAAGGFASAGGVPANSIASWDGTAWSALGSGLDSYAYALCTFDDGNGTALYAGGGFVTAGGVQTGRIAKWDGSAWSALPNLPFLQWVYALCVFDDGSGPALYVGGRFVRNDGSTESNIKKFDGTSWSNLGAGLGSWLPGVSHPECLTVYDDGNGPALYAGGYFLLAGGAPARHVAKWDGSTWSSLGSGLDKPAHTLTTWNDGSGWKLVVGGEFIVAGGKPANYVATWDGTQWKPIRGGLQGELAWETFAYAAVAHDEGLGHGSELFVAGDFTTADSVATHSIARYGPCTPVGQTFCFGDGSLPTPCPCFPPSTVPNPSGGSDGGCANSFVATGGKLVASGTTNPDTVRLLVSDISPAGFGTFISGNASEDAGVASSDGVRCAGGAFVRFGPQNAIYGCSRYPNALVGWSLPLSQISSVTPGSGAVRHYQFVYRNVGFNFCNPSTLNWTNAVTLIW